MSSRSSRSLPEPCLWHRQQEEFAARPEQVSFLLVSHRALPDLQRMKLLLFCGRVVGTEVGILLVRISPLVSWTRGSWSTSDCRHGPHQPRSTLLRVLMYGTPRRRRNRGGRDGTAVSTLLRSRRSQRDGGGLPAPCSRWQGHDRSSYLPDDHGGPSALVGVAGSKRVHACGHGGDRRLLEASVAHLG